MHHKTKTRLSLFILATQSFALFAGGGHSKDRNFVGKKAIEKTTELEGTVNEHAHVLVDKVSGQAAHDFGKNLMSGLTAGLDYKEISSKGEALGAAIFTGMAGAAKSGLIAVPAATKAAAIKAATVVVTAPATPRIVGGGAVVAFLGYGYNIECQKEYGHCLRTHFDSSSTDEEKMPRRCHSPERRAMWWGKNWASQQKRIFKILKEEGRRPRPAKPGSPYWSNEGPNVMGKDDLEHGKK